MLNEAMLNFKLDHIRRLDPTSRGLLCQLIEAIQKKRSPSQVAGMIEMAESAAAPIAGQLIALPGVGARDVHEPARTA
jgi:hypothetical protein